MSDVNALDLEPGNIVGGYVLESRLGGGAMGSVWRVRDGGGQEFAMKILRDSLSDDDSCTQSADRGVARERLRREATALRRINHAGVCRIVDMELDDAIAFIVTELIEGNDLRQDVRTNGAYKGGDLERLAERLTDAVEAVHAAGIIHRDIKPGNVMISARGPVLVDFGIAMSENQSHVTRTGLVMGTPGFIAPEIIEGAESDETTDWWSLSSVLAFAATGRSVFGTSPMMAVLQREAAGNADLTGLPPATMKALRSALDPHRDERPDPRSLVEAIRSDAVHGSIWATSKDDPDANGADDRTAAMPPFDVGASSPRSLRTMWMPMDGTVLERRSHPDQTTTAVTTAQMATRTMPGGQEPTTAMEALPPRRTSDEETEKGETEDPTYDPTYPPFPEDDYQGLGQETPAADPIGEESRRRRSGRIRVTVAGIPITLLSLVVPVWSILLGGLMLWILAAIGASRRFRWRRAAHHEGQWKKSDALLRAAASPWLVLSALGTALLVTAIAVAISVPAIAVAMMTPALTHADITMTIGGWTPVIPLPSAETPSTTGAIVAIIVGVAWTIAVNTAPARTAWYGAGSISAPSDYRRMGNTIVVWTIISCLACLPFLLGYPLTCSPLVP